jgi:hypothetical protein
MAERPLPIPTHETFLKTFHSAVGDNNPNTQKTLQQRYNFGYRNGVGELIYAMVTCRTSLLSLLSAHNTVLTLQRSISRPSSTPSNIWLPHAKMGYTSGGPSRLWTYKTTPCHYVQPPYMDKSHQQYSDHNMTASTSNYTPMLTPIGRRALKHDAPSRV